MAQKQAKEDRAMQKIMSGDPRSLPQSDIHLPASDIRVARFNDPGMMMADGARIGAEMMATDIAVGKIIQGVGALRAGESVWSLNALQRGRAIENMLGADASWARNFPTIDKIENGVATSIKSMDLTATSYQKGNSVLNTLKGYVDSLSSFSSKTWGGTAVTQGESYTSKALELAVQSGKGSEAQWGQINQAIQYALDKDINVTIRFIK
ncbi:endonuclease toxin domain-containing protein [Flavobacterium restrictum]